MFLEDSIILRVQCKGWRRKRGDPVGTVRVMTASFNVYSHALTCLLRSLTLTHVRPLFISKRGLTYTHTCIRLLNLDGLSVDMLFTVALSAPYHICKVVAFWMKTTSISYRNYLAIYIPVCKRSREDEVLEVHT